MRTFFKRICVVFCLFGNGSLFSQTQLLVGKTTESEISALKPVTYLVKMEKGQLAAISLWQKSVSLYTVIRDPKDSLYQVVDDNGIGHKEVITILADTSGDYKITVYWNFVKPLSGRFSITLDKIETAASDLPSRAKQLLGSWYDGKGPGAAVVVVKNNKVVFEDYKGFANLEEQVKIGTNSVFELASVSKQFTAFGIALLVDRKILSMEDDIRKFLPELPDYGAKICLSDLVYHTSGIRDWVDCFQFMGLTPEDVATHEMVVKFAFNQQHLKFPTGEKYNYSNTNYSLLAEIVTRVTGKPFAVWMKENVFDPLGMRSTFFKEVPGYVYANKVLSYKPVGDHFNLRLLNNAVMGPQACYSNMEDLVNWVNSFSSRQLITPVIDSLLIKPGILHDGKPTAYAFGNNITRYKGFDKIDHLGLFCGFRTSIARFPKENLSVIYLSNDDNDASYGRATKIADLFLEARPYKPSVKRIPDPAVILKGIETSDTALAPVPLEEFTGTYFSPELGSSLQLVIKNKRLVITHPRMNDIVLSYSVKDSFGFARFTRNNSGQISGFTILGENMEFVKVKQ